MSEVIATPVNEQEEVCQDTAPEGAEEQTVPTSDLRKANATLVKFGEECRKQADANYVIAKLAFAYVEEFLGAAPGHARRSTAVENLAEERRKWDADSMAISLQDALKRQRGEVNRLIRGHAVATLIGDGADVMSGDGTKKGKGRGGKQKLPWGKLLEFANLVYREDSNHVERWHILPSVAQEARELLVEVAASGMSRKDVAVAVAKLSLKDAELELAAARESGEAERIRKAESDVERCGGKVERKSAAAPQSGTTQPSQGKDNTNKGADKGTTPPAPQNPPADKDGEDKGKAAQQDGKDKECRATNLIQVAKGGTVKDVAEMAVELITGGDAPDSVFEMVLSALAKHKDMCGASRRACQAALLTLNQSAKLDAKQDMADQDDDDNDADDAHAEAA